MAGKASMGGVTRDDEKTEEAGKGFLCQLADEPAAILYFLAAGVSTSTSSTSKINVENGLILPVLREP